VLAMAFWIFKCNPEKYRVADRLADPNPDITWIVSRYRDQMGPGDTIFIWETGPDRGIRAVLRADGVPEDMQELESEQPYNTERDNEVRCRVRATITDRDVNLSHSDLRSVPGLENLSVFHGFQQRTNFPVTPEEGAILLELVRRRGRGVQAMPKTADDEGVFSMPRVWWCNQTRCWNDERPACLVCSHIDIEATEGAMKYRRMVSEARAGDITVHYRSGHRKSIVALSRAITDAVEGTVDLRRYGVTGKVCWEEPRRGWSFEADYYDLASPIPKRAVIEELNRLEIQDGPIASHGQIRQGYFMRFSVEGLRILRRASTEDWPEWAEAASSSHDTAPDNEIVKFLNHVFDQGIPEHRAAPDNLRRGRFQAGWEDFTKKRKKYDDLDYLTWQNLGNRCGVRYGDQPREQIREVYDIAAGLYDKAREQTPASEIGESIHSPPERVQFTTTRIIRDTAKARRLKEAYESRCQICRKRIELGSSCFYAEVHHIRPLGGRHRGSDVHDNMLVVCPTHHAMFDLGVVTFSSDKLVSIGGKLYPLTLKHRIATENLAYHNAELVRLQERDGLVGDHGTPLGSSRR